MWLCPSILAPSASGFHGVCGPVSWDELDALDGAGVPIPNESVIGLCEPCWRGAILGAGPPALRLCAACDLLFLDPGGLPGFLVRITGSPVSVLALFVGDPPIIDDGLVPP